MDIREHNMKRWIITAAIALSILIITSLCIDIASRYSPSKLIIHVNAQTLKSITVSSDNLRTPRTFTRTNALMVVTPIEYGDYRFDIKLANGHNVIAAYYHCDAGARRRVDIYIDQIARTDDLRMRCVLHTGVALLRETTDTDCDTVVKASKNGEERILILSHP